MNWLCVAVSSWTQLRENYLGVDYSALKKDSDEFHAIAGQALGTAKKKPR